MGLRGSRSLFFLEKRVHFLEFVPCFEAYLLLMDGSWLHQISVSTIRGIGLNTIWWMKIRLGIMKYRVTFGLQSSCHCQAQTFHCGNDGVCYRLFVFSSSSAVWFESWSSRSFVCILIHWCLRNAGTRKFLAISWLWIPMNRCAPLGSRCLITDTLRCVKYR